MRKGIYILPNLFTMGNMFCGFYAILGAFNGRYEQAAIAIMIAAVLDGLDGRIARLTNSCSRFGVEFDSLADLISFGAAPAFLVYSWALQPMGRLGWAGTFLFLSCGALRLARFNIQCSTSESKYFTGLPIPAAACVLASMVIFYENLHITPELPLVILLITYCLAFLMVSRVRYRSLKEVDLKKRRPFSLLVVVSLAVFILVSQPHLVFFLAFTSYALSGLLEWPFLRHRVRKGTLVSNKRSLKIEHK